MLYSFATLLSPEQVVQVHEAPWRSSSGWACWCATTAPARFFAEHGAQVDEQTQIVRIPAEVVESYRSHFPAKFTFHARDPRKRPHRADDSRWCSPQLGSNLIDPVTGYERRARSDDLARIAHLVTSCPVMTSSLFPPWQTTPRKAVQPLRYYPSIKNSLSRCAPTHPQPRPRWYSSWLI